MAEGYAPALALTLALEVPVWAVLGHVAVAVPWARATVIGVAVNVVSHPLLWFVLVPALEATTGSTVVALTVAEVVVGALEAGLAWLATRRAPAVWLAVSAAANLISLGAGALLLAR